MYKQKKLRNIQYNGYRIYLIPNLRNKCFDWLIDFQFVTRFLFFSLLKKILSAQNLLLWQQGNLNYRLFIFVLHLIYTLPILKVTINSGTLYNSKLRECHVVFGAVPKVFPTCFGTMRNYFLWFYLGADATGMNKNVNAWCLARQAIRKKYLFFFQLFSTAS